MKKFIKGNIKVVVAVVITAVICICGTVYAAGQILASDISYRNGTVESALNDLYDKANNSSGAVCIRIDGIKETVGAKYVCDLGENTSRKFYILSVNGDTVKMIMEKNLSDEVGSNSTMSWNDAISFFDENHPGYILKQTWLTRVQSVDLPDAQDIANAGGINNGTTTSWNVNVATENDWAHFGTNSQEDTSKRSSYLWLWNYTNCSVDGCINSAYNSGYWTKNMIVNDNTNAWRVSNFGSLDGRPASRTEYEGVRPVIVLSKSKLAG